MTYSNIMLTLTLVVVTSCYTFAKPTTADRSLLLSHFLSPRYIPHLGAASSSSSSYALPPSSSSSSDNDNSENYNDIRSSSNNNNINTIVDDDDDDDDGDDDESIFISPQLMRHRVRGDDVYSLQNELTPVPIQNGMSLEDMRRLKFLMTSIRRQQQEEAGVGGPTTERGKRYIPGLNALFTARLLSSSGNSFSGMSSAGKRKRQPHLGFHASRG